MRNLISFATLLSAVWVCCSWAQTADHLREVGTITISSTLTWDAQPGHTFNIYVSETNETAFTKAATVETNYWAGTNTTALNGWKVLYITAAQGGKESVPSEMVLVRFDAGRILPPTNIQLYTVIHSAATNAMPRFNPPPPFPAPVPPRQFNGPEWERSKRQHQN